MEPNKEFGYTEKTEKEKPLNFSTGLFVGLMAGMIIAFLVTMVVPRICAATPATDRILDAATAQKIEKLGATIQNKYYEDTDLAQLREGLYRGLFESLGDKYSVYYSAEEYKKVMEGNNGSFSGIGAVLTQDEVTNKVYVINIYEDSPAEEVGLQAGDVIVQADDIVATSMKLSDFVTHLRGESGSVVHLKILRGGEYLEYDVTRKNVDYYTVAGIILEDGIGYIRIVEFANNSVTQFDKVLAELEEKGADRFIIDLRSNPGGVLTSAVSIADRFLPEGVVVSTRDKDGNTKNYNSYPDHKEYPLAVLIDKNTGSASEVFAGAIRDYKAGTLIGTTTFGKGIVQEVSGLSDGSAYKITSAKYYTPNGENIHGIGIKPDVELGYKWDDSDIEYEDDYLRDNQVMKAIEILKADK